MHISSLHDYGSEDAETKAMEFVTDNRKKQIKDVLEELINDEFERLEEYAGEYISQVAADRAEKFLEKVLNGDDEAANELLGARPYDRERSSGEPWASVIHGRIFEAGGIDLRRKIVDAYPELLKNERIADLESVVEGLRKQILGLERQIKQMSRNYD